MKKLLYITVAAVMAVMSVQVCLASDVLTPVTATMKNGHTYILYDDSLTWTEAEEFCENNGGYLVTITSEEEQAVVESIIAAGDKSTYWIGLKENGENNWNWVSEEEFDYENWGKGEPNNSGGEAYGEIVRTPFDALEFGTWNDMKNDGDTGGSTPTKLSDKGFICEIYNSNTAKPTENKVTADIPEDAVEYNGHSYMFSDEKMTWEEAKEYCESLGGYLAVVTSEGEWNFLHEIIIENRTHYWLGASDAEEEGNWEWVNGEAWNYSDWCSGEPNNDYSGTEDYLGTYTNSYKWNDYRGSTSLNFICEWDTLGFKKSTSNWSTTEIQEAYENDLIPEFLVEEDLTENISRAEFASVSLKLYEALTGKKVTSGESLPFNDVAGLENYSDIQKAYMLDIAIGTSPVTFEPYADINREQLVTMLTRTLKKYKYPEWTIETDSEYALLAGSISKKFADDEDISDFARDSVYYMSEMGIVTGVDSTHFAPKNTTEEQEAEGYAAATREQALALSLRILKKADLL